MFLRPNVGAFSTEGALLRSWDGEGGGGLVLTPGRYARPLALGVFWDFGGWGLKVQVRGGWSRAGL